MDPFSSPIEGALQILERALSSLGHAATAGTTPRQIEARARDVLAASRARAILIEERNERGERFGFAACVCVNDAAANAVPSDVALRPGDLVTIDVALGFPVGASARDRPLAVVDGATTLVVPGGERGRAVLLRDAARAATRACVAAVRPGITPAALREVARSVAERAGVLLAEIALVHRVAQDGGALHVPLAEHLPLLAGDVIAIEPLVVDGPDARLVVEPDEFTLRTVAGALAAYEECTVVVGDDEAIARVMPPIAARPWLFE